MLPICLRAHHQTTLIPVIVYTREASGGITKTCAWSEVFLSDDLKHRQQPDGAACAEICRAEAKGQKLSCITCAYLVGWLW
jgi:hypothetical protein